MVIVESLQKKISSFAIFVSYVIGISYASHLEGDFEVFFPSEITTISLATAGTFCVARPNADPNLLKSGVDWACGPGLANCGPIQPGQPCYVANNIVAIASYAYNAYFQANQAKGGTCYFSNTAILTSADPSTGSCIFPGSTGSGTSPGGGTNSSGTPPGGIGTPPGGIGTPPGGIGTPPGGIGTPPGGIGTPGASGTPPGSPGTPGGSSFTPSFQPTYNDSGVSEMQGLTLFYLSPLVFISLLIM